MPAINAKTVLDFATPESTEPRNYDEAERQCLGFTELFLRKSRELNEAQRTLTEVLDDMDQRISFVIRNLLDCLENCLSLLAVPTGGSPTEPGVAAPPTEVSPPANSAAELTDSPAEPAVIAPLAPVAVDANSLGLASVERSLVYLLEELGVRRVSLMDQTYVTVMVDGRPIADPFEVMSTTQQGKASDRKVTRVLRDLWVDRDGRVVQKGSVIC